MNSEFFQVVKSALEPRLAAVAESLLPGGRIVGKEYVCGSLEGGEGKSCRINLQSGVGSDFATGETCSDIIDLAAKVWNMRPYEAAKELANQYGIEHRVFGPVTAGKEIKIGLDFTPILPVPKNAPEPTRRHSQYGMCVKQWRYLNAFGELMFCTARFDLADGKVVLPQCYGRFGKSHKQWCWKSLPDNRPLYGLQKLRSMPQSTVLLVEGEKTADAAQSLFPEYVAMTWSGGSKAIAKSDFSPLYERNIVIWPDNDKPGIEVAASLCALLAGKAKNIRIVLPDVSLPDSWDLADKTPVGLDIRQCLQNALVPNAFLQAYRNRFQKIEIKSENPPEQVNVEEFDIKEWPKFSMDACPGILGDFVSLATRDSEADPALHNRSCPLLRGGLWHGAKRGATYPCG